MEELQFAYIIQGRSCIPKGDQARDKLTIDLQLIKSRKIFRAGAFVINSSKMAIYCRRSLPWMAHGSIPA